MDLGYDLHVTLVEQRAYVEYKLKRLILVNVIFCTTQSLSLMSLFCVCYGRRGLRHYDINWYNCFSHILLANFFCLIVPC